MNAEPSHVVHVAGMVLTVGDVIRQRCAWCGALIDERDTSRMAVQVDTTASPEVQQHEANEAIHRTRWEPGALVAIAGDGPGGGGAYWVVDEPADGKVPPESCMALDDGVTR